MRVADVHFDASSDERVDSMQRMLCGLALVAVMGCSGGGNSGGGISNRLGSGNLWHEGGFPDMPAGADGFAGWQALLSHAGHRCVLDQQQPLMR